MAFALALVTMLNAATPGIVQLIMMIRKNDGTVSVVAMLDEADKQFAENMNMALEWLKAHGKV
jgi:hypothetical protein